MRRLTFGSALLLGACGIGIGFAQPPGRGGPPPKFELGRVLPPRARDRIELTKEQEKQIADLEREVKQRLEKILTADQKKALEALGPPGGPGGRGPGGPPPREDRNPPAAAAPDAGIQWFTTWETAKAEAARTGRPILLVSAAPHCAGVSGIW